MQGTAVEHMGSTLPSSFSPLGRSVTSNLRRLTLVLAIAVIIALSDVSPFSPWRFNIVESNPVLVTQLAQADSVPQVAAPINIRFPKMIGTVGQKHFQVLQAAKQSSDERLSNGEPSQSSWSIIAAVLALVCSAVGVTAFKTIPSEFTVLSTAGQGPPTVKDEEKASGDAEALLLGRPDEAQVDPMTCRVVEGGLVCELPDDLPPITVEIKSDVLEAEMGTKVLTEDAPLLPVKGIPSVLASILQWTLLVSPFFMWGTSMVAMKETIEHATPLFIAGVRCVPAGLIILAFCAARGKPVIPRSWKGWSWVLGFALVDATMFQGFLAEGLRLTSAGLGSVIIDSQPLTVAVLAALFFGESMGPKGVLGLVLGLIGIGMVELAPENVASLISASEGATLANISIWESGEWWMLLAAQSMAVGTVMVRLFAKEVDPVLATGWHLLLGGIPLFALSGFLDGPLVDQAAILTLSDWLRLGYVSIFGGAVGYGLFFYAAERGSLTKLSSLTFLTPMFAVLGGYIFLSETLTPIQAVGAVVTLAAIYLINGPKA